MAADHSVTAYAKSLDIAPLCLRFLPGSDKNHLTCRRLLFDRHFPSAACTRYGILFYCRRYAYEKGKLVGRYRRHNSRHCLPSAFRSWQVMRSGYSPDLLAILQGNPGRTTPDFASVHTLAVLAILRFPC